MQRFLQHVSEEKKIIHERAQLRNEKNLSQSKIFFSHTKFLEPPCMELKIVYEAVYEVREFFGAWENRKVMSQIFIFKFLKNFILN